MLPVLSAYYHLSPTYQQAPSSVIKVLQTSYPFPFSVFSKRFDKPAFKFFDPDLRI